jgi:ATP-dependent RNA helicase SUPV3L1/SUV3
MPLESNKKLLKTIKEQSAVFENKFKANDNVSLKNSEKDLIKHLNRINSILADLAYARKQFKGLETIKKLKAKDFREKKELKDTISFLESEENFLLEDRARMRDILKEASKLVWQEYSLEKKIPYSFDEIIDNSKNLRFFYNEGIVSTYNIRFVPQVLGNDIRKAFPKNPKDEFKEAREMKRHFIIHQGGTNSGKTYHSLKRLMEAENGLYLAPLRLLALEVHDRLNANNVPCNLKTGEEEILVRFAQHTSSTVEKADMSGEYEVVVIDEAQMLGDSQRGAAWTRAILGVKAKEVHICCAPYATEIIKTMIEDCKDTLEIINHERDTELVVEDFSFKFPSSVRDGDALIVFSRKSVLTVAAALEEKRIPCSLIYGSLPPETRRMQFEKFLKKDTRVLVSTDAIGMGVNLPIKRVVFLEDEKFDGVDVRPLASTETKQIAGRAGRKGIYDVGYVNTIFQESKKRLSKYLIRPEQPLERAILAPTEDILKVDAELDTKLKVWASIEPEEDFYEKINVDRLIELINLIKHLGLKKHLDENEIFKAINIPFDENEDSILQLWAEYLFAYATGKINLIKPQLENDELLDLEIYYRKIDLYYSFSKTFNFQLDDDWIRLERSRVAKLIDKHLKEKIKRYRKSCRTCGRPLPWDHIHPTCDRCFTSNRF